MVFRFLDFNRGVARSSLKLRIEPLSWTGWASTTVPFTVQTGRGIKKEYTG